MGAWEGMAVWCRRDRVDDLALSMPGLRRTMIAIERRSNVQVGRTVAQMMVKDNEAVAMFEKEE